MKILKIQNDSKNFGFSFRSKLTLAYIKIFSIAVHGAGQHLDRPVLVLEHELGRAFHSYDLRLRKEQAVVQW